MKLQNFSKYYLNAVFATIRRTIFISTLFTLVVILQSCFTFRTPKITFEEPLQLKGEKIRMDGYYYRSKEAIGYMRILIFFKDGMLVEGNYRSFEELDSFLNKHAFEPTRRTGAFRVKNNLIDLKYYAVKNSSGKWAIQRLQAQLLSSDTLKISDKLYHFKEHNIVSKQQ